MSRIPGTYEKGDRVRLPFINVEGTVFYDNRKDGGRNVWVEWDTEPGVQVCSVPETFTSVGAGRTEPVPKTQAEMAAFAKDWDAKVEAGRKN